MQPTSNDDLLETALDGQRVDALIDSSEVEPRIVQEGAIIERPFAGLAREDIRPVAEVKRGPQQVEKEIGQLEDVRSSLGKIVKGETSEQNEGASQEHTKTGESITEDTRQVLLDISYELPLKDGWDDGLTSEAQISAYLKDQANNVYRLGKETGIAIENDVLSADQVRSVIAMLEAQGVKINIPLPEETKLMRQQEFDALPEMSSARIAKKIGETLPPELTNISDEDMRKRQENLRTRPQLGRELTDTIMHGNTEIGGTFKWVETNKIIGAAWVAEDGWASEIEERAGRVVTVAQEIAHAYADNGEGEEVYDPRRPSEGQKAIEHIYHPSGPTEQIKLVAINGPAGPIYSVMDGTHRVSASMVLGLPEIPCEVTDRVYPIIITSYDKNVSEGWKKKIELGLIDGDVSEESDGTRLTIRGEILPWIHSSNPADLAAISRVYEQAYPGSLNNLSVPRDTLVSAVAFQSLIGG